MFLNKIRNIFCVPDSKFVSATNVAHGGKRGNICVGNTVSATMCPRLPGPLALIQLHGRSIKHVVVFLVDSHEVSQSLDREKLPFLLPKQKSHSPMLIVIYWCFWPPLEHVLLLPFYWPGIEICKYCRVSAMKSNDLYYLHAMYF